MTINRYKQRDDVLLQMGYANYRDYLASPLWASIRRRIFAACKLCPCGREATAIHHRTYKRRYLEGRGKIYKFLTPICRQHHHEIEFRAGEKNALGWANRYLDEIRASAEASGIVMPNKCRLFGKKRRPPARVAEKLLQRRDESLPH